MEIHCLKNVTKIGKMLASFEVVLNIHCLKKVIRMVQDTFIFWNGMEVHGLKNVIRMVQNTFIFWNGMEVHGLKNVIRMVQNTLIFWNGMEVHGLKNAIRIQKCFALSNCTMKIHLSKKKVIMIGRGKTQSMWFRFERGDPFHWGSSSSRDTHWLKSHTLHYWSQCTYSSSSQQCDQFLTVNN